MYYGLQAMYHVQDQELTQRKSGLCEPLCKFLVSLRPK